MKISKEDRIPLLTRVFDRIKGPIRRKVDRNILKLMIIMVRRSRRTMLKKINGKSFNQIAHNRKLFQIKTNITKGYNHLSIIRRRNHRKNHKRKKRANPCSLEIQMRI